MPRLKAKPFPGRGSKRTVAPFSSAFDAVSSVEALSTTIILALGSISKID